MEFLRGRLFWFRLPFLSLRAEVVIFPDLLDLVKIVRDLCSSASQGLG